MKSKKNVNIFFMFFFMFYLLGVCTGPIVPEGLNPEKPWTSAVVITFQLLIVIGVCNIIRFIQLRAGPGSCLRKMHNSTAFMLLPVLHPKPRPRRVIVYCWKIS
jgi:hypothetical protein